MGDSLIIQIKNDEENQVNHVKGDQNPEQPPSGSRGEQQREAASRMIKQESEFFPQSTLFWHQQRDRPDYETQHAGESSVADDDEEGAK